ncbi:LON peptidase substrate-binding domain-containing protein [Streptomyces sp. WMMC897]|uniref:LON peptidase substrate-binding domain-containing protein n=1 Tax=Streptomyces sp. WMMC897 TaxID=3014782 RepID=UPI0022B6A7C5|nr:LON peptidase substrate-binding domain-containing protein [Streptomyces sp. WMMC897]MCZ7413749.1 LON peptidase substrate-binding domain-containing protein [Streptomyces sp. WMMC897]
MTIALPLFPLNTVLFPGLVLPLNVFEPRYRALMRDLQEIPEDEPRPFGVVAIRDGFEVAPTAVGLPGDDTADPGPAAGFGPDPAASFHSVGCVADASTIREREGTDGYEVLATGTSRFRLLSVDASGPYLVGEVEELEEDSGEGAGALAAGVLRAFGEYRKRLAGAQQLTLTTGQELPEEPSVVSYLVAAATVLDTVTKQRLLQAPDTASRLAEELRLLRRETAVLGELPSLPAVDLTHRPTSPN